MVTGELRRVQAALQIGQSSLQYRRALRSAIKAGAGGFGMLMSLLGTRVIL